VQLYYPLQDPDTVMVQLESKFVKGAGVVGNVIDNPPFASIK